MEQDLSTREKVLVVGIAVLSALCSAAAIGFLVGFFLGKAMLLL